MRHIFISYSRSDLDIVNLLETDLSERGHEVWLDVNNIRSGEEWAGVTEQKIRQAYAFILIVSSRSMESAWVNREINCALLNPKKIPIVPILLDDTQIKRGLEKWQFVDFSKVLQSEGIQKINHYKSAMTRLLDGLEKTRPVLSYLNQIKNPDEQIREHAAKELGKLADPIATRVLIEALSDLDSDVRFEATKALGKLKSKSAYKHLIRLTEEEDVDICSAAADALGKIGLPHTIGALLQLLQHPDRFVRENTARAIGKIGKKDGEGAGSGIGAVEPLIELMRNDSISDVREAATQALKDIGGPIAERAIDRKKNMKSL